MPEKFTCQIPATIREEAQDSALPVSFLHGRQEECPKEWRKHPENQIDAGVQKAVFETADSAVKTVYDILDPLRGLGMFAGMKNGEQFRIAFTDALAVEIQNGNPNMKSKDAAVAFAEDTYGQVVEAMLLNSRPTEEEFRAMVQAAILGTSMPATQIASL